MNVNKQHKKQTKQKENYIHFEENFIKLQFFKLRITRKGKKTNKEKF